MSTAPAWIIPLPGNVRVAVGTLELVHVLPDVPALSTISGAPAFIKEAVSWDGSIIPVFDAGKFGRGIERTADAVYYGIVRFRSVPSDAQRFGALKMTAIPQRVAVDDQMACDLPESHGHWRPICVSCFSLDGYPVPVLDLARLFSQTPLDSANGAKTAVAEAGVRADPEKNGSDPTGYNDSLATT